jgi:BASS family bile acid:Na+ symporter
MYINLKKWIESHFSVMLFLGVGAGLFLPYLDKLPNYTPIFLVGCVMFFSCAKIAKGQMQDLNRINLSIFYVLRFVLLPIALYYAANAIIPQYALGVLLVASMPIGGAATAVCGMTGGNPSLALIATIITSSVAPFIIPLMIWFCSGEEVAIDKVALLLTLASCIFCPALLYFSLYKIRPAVKNVVLRHSQFAVTIALSSMVACVVAFRRDYFFANMTETLIAFMIVSILYMLLYGFGVAFAWRMNKPIVKIKTYAVCSGVNNIALSAAIAVLYFSSHTVVFTVLGEIAWVVAISIYKKIAQANLT